MTFDWDVDNKRWYKKNIQEKERSQAHFDME